ncbi:MAG: cation diffusion facilitator family transporter [Methanoregula sp.]|nr:cation diffusion facilitator family transporter [Methanoregula sp.]
MAHGMAGNEAAESSLPPEVKERAVFTSLAVDAILWLPDIVAAVLSGSIVLRADVLKCGNEILATFFAWLTLRKIIRGGGATYDYGMGKFETTTSLITGGVMFVSLALVFYSAVYRIEYPEPIRMQGAALGVVLMVIGVCANSWLWRKNYRLAIKDPSPVMDSQWQLFRTKAFSDLSVLIALILSIGLSEYSWSMYIDPLASFIIAGFLFFSGYRVITSSLPDLLDKTLDEELQIIIVRELAVFFNDYHALHGVRSRHSGSNIYIEIFLEFDGTQKMCDVQATINRIKLSLEKKILKSSVSIVPTSTHACSADDSSPVNK